MNFRKYIPWLIVAIIVIWLVNRMIGSYTPPDLPNNHTESIHGYNGLVGATQNVNSKWSQVEAAYQRRADLIPNLVATVRQAADFEKSTIESVIQARANATSIKVDPKDLTPEKLQQFQQAQTQLSGALGRLLAVAENYPQLKAVGNFSELQSQLEGTENRINEARRQFIEASQNYNTARQSFPTIIVAKLFDFKDKPYFQADQGAEKAPSVSDEFKKK